MASPAEQYSNRLDSGVYDIVFAGGGAVACVTAGRLTAADPSLKILILEAGPHTRELQDHIQPARYFRNLNLPSETFTFHAGKPSEALAGRSVIVPNGKCLGGGSSVNFAVYTRAAASDYDDWERVHGNNGWGSDDLIPLSKKAETYQPGIEPGNTTHGDSGPIKVSHANGDVNVGLQFLDVARAYDKGRGFTDDVNNFFSCDAYGKWPKYVDEESGRRSDTPHHYIYNQTPNKNFKILDRQRVIRVVFEGYRAVGVEYVSDTVKHAKGVQQPILARASRLVVVSAGAFGSPAILERSGVGAAGILKKNNVQQIVDLPGVGEHYLDHNAAFPPYLASEDADTLDVLFRGSAAEIKPFADEWLHTGRGLMSHNALDAGIKMRPNAKDLEEIGPIFGKRWQGYFANAPDKPVVWLGPLAAYIGANPFVSHRKYFSLAYYTEYPVSSGCVHITAGLDAYAPLHFEPGYLNDPADLVVLRWAYKKSREYARRMDAYRGEFEPGHPRFPKDSAAAVGTANGPVEVSSPDIVYSEDDNKIIDTYHRENIVTAWHSMGTCAMKPREKGGVVDARLNLYGVTNLKVADCSISPDNVGGNTYNTALTIGEKAAVIIAEDLGVKGI